MHIKKATHLTTAAILVFTLFACGGGGSTGTGSVTLGGTAAVGTPIKDATVQVTCANGAALTSAPTSPTGAWQVTLGSQTFPCAAQLTGGTIASVPNNVKYHSIATGSGTMNVTPLTDLLVANLTGQVPASWFSALTPSTLAAISTASFNAALTQLRSGLNVTQLAALNPVSLAFSPVAGNLMDDLLSSLQTALASLSSPAVSYTDLLTAAQAPTFVPPAGLATAYGSAFAKTGSGNTASASGCPSGGAGASTYICNRPGETAITSADADQFVGTYDNAGTNLYVGQGMVAYYGSSPIANTPVSACKMADGSLYVSYDANGSRRLVFGQSGTTKSVGGSLPINPVATITNAVQTSCFF